MDYDCNVRDLYTGKWISPIEDLSIHQPDGTRACYNWECGEGFGILDTSNHTGQAYIERLLKDF
jgi:hypothetical protein